MREKCVVEIKTFYETIEKRLNDALGVYARSQVFFHQSAASTWQRFLNDPTERKLSS
jgi:hypothetical protein